MPGKAAYQRFETDETGQAWFEFQLAEHLHMTVGEVRQMNGAEYIEWQAYLMRKDQLKQVRTKGR